MVGLQASHRRHHSLVVAALPAESAVGAQHFCVYPIATNVVGVRPAVRPAMTTTTRLGWLRGQLSPPLKGRKGFTPVNRTKLLPCIMSVPGQERTGSSRLCSIQVQRVQPVQLARPTKVTKVVDVSGCVQIVCDQGGRFVSSTG